MFKRIIEPVQMWLLKRGQCVGCGRKLSIQPKSAAGKLTKVMCGCGRIFIEEGKTYRRALFSEI